MMDGLDLLGQSQEDTSDDEKFVAFCTDASSVLSNDYHINELYQPLVEQDDEYLLYQELRFLESTSQADDKDALDRMNITNIIEDFESEPPTSSTSIEPASQQDQELIEQSELQLENGNSSQQDQEQYQSYHETQPFQQRHRPLEPQANLNISTVTSDADHTGDDESTSLCAPRVTSRQPHPNKYRRRTANARERIRMREINQAFEKLKKVVPVEMAQQAASLASGDESDQTTTSSRRGGHQDSQSVKLTKITTLRLAVSYIAKLTGVLEQHSDEPIARLPASSGSGAGETNINSSQSTDCQDIKFGKTRADDKLGGRSKITPKRRRTRCSSTIKSEPAAKSTFGKIKSVDKTDPQQPTFALNQQTATLVLNQNNATNQMQNNNSQPILIATTNNNMLHQQAAGPFVSIQQHQLKHQQQQHFTFAATSQPQAQSATVSGRQQVALTNQNGQQQQQQQLVTPIALAILGIPNQTGGDGPQQLQLVGIQGAQRLQPQRPQHHPQQNAFNLIAPHQPQQVTLTLDDLNGLSVLRLANPQQGAFAAQQPTTIQLQPAVNHQQAGQQQFTTNYATAYQQVHFSQFQHSGGQQHQLAAIQQIPQQAVLQICNPPNNPNGPNSNDLQQQQPQDAINRRRTAITDGTTFGQQQQASQVITSSNPNHNCSNSTTQMVTMVAMKSPTTTSTTAANTITGTNSDCRNFAIHPNMIAQHLNINNNQGNIASDQQQTQQMKVQQSNCLIPQQQLALQSRPVTTGAPTLQPTNLIYINRPAVTTTVASAGGPQLSSQANQAAKIEFHHFQNQQQLQSYQAGSQPELISSPSERQADSTSDQLGFDQAKFVTQFSSQMSRRDQSLQSNEANIRQLVATLTTSIGPANTDVKTMSRLVDSGDKAIQQPQPPQQQQQQQRHSNQYQNNHQQQLKRTYRFHNYDGNMISNNLYNNSNQDKQQVAAKRSQLDNQPQQPQQTSNTANGSQRSRQNSLSSTCSSASCSSSSLASSVSNSSPSLVPILVATTPVSSSSKSPPVSTAGEPITSSMQVRGQTAPIVGDS